jgi:hypothetical protein
MKVFISHSWNDKSIAAEINETLQKDGHEVWFDVHQLIPGDQIQEVIDSYIIKTDVVVLVWTINAHKSAGVNDEIATAKRLGKRIIPLQADETPLDNHPILKGSLGIPLDDKQTGLLLLQRALLMLMASDFKEASWFKEAFGNVVDLGGYLNYSNTFRLKQNKNDDGYKEEWVSRLERLTKENEEIRVKLLPKMQDKMQTLQNIMQQLEKGNASLDDLTKWKQWCQDNEDFQPGLMKKLQEFLSKDISRLDGGGAPISILDMEMVARAITRLKAAIDQKKDEAYRATVDRIKKYAGFLMGDKTISSIATGYLNYVTTSPGILQQLVHEASVSEYVAVKESTVKLVKYLEQQDHEKEMNRPHLEGYFDDAYLINNTVKLLIEAKLVEKDRITLDFVSVNIIDRYVGFLLDSKIRNTLELVLQEIRDLIGLKKNEINWGQIAALMLGTVVVGSIASKMSGGVAKPKANSPNDSGSPFFEDQVASFSARYGGGLNANSPIQY